MTQHIITRSFKNYFEKKIICVLTGLPSPQNVRVLSTSNTTITLSWTTPLTNDTITGYFVGCIVNLWVGLLACQNYFFNIHHCSLLTLAHEILIGIDKLVKLFRKKCIDNNETSTKIINSESQ